MRNYLLAAAAVALATPAMARDGAPYVGIEGGILIAEDLEQDVTFDDGTSSARFDEAFEIDFKKGGDFDLIAGYDFGMFRVEGEAGYKFFRTDGVRLSNRFQNETGLTDAEFDISERAGVISLMGNAMLDLGNDDDRWNVFVGAGIGGARVRLAGDRDSAFAYQAIGGVRYALTPNFDLGLKYRYFRTAKVEFDDDFNDGVDSFGIASSGKLRTHSVLASLIYNFAAPAPIVVAPVIAPPAPVEVAPATQTCPDGTVILATDICPAPPPVPAPERG